MRKIRRNTQDEGHFQHFWWDKILGANRQCKLTPNIKIAHFEVMPNGHPVYKNNIDFGDSVQEENWEKWWIKPYKTPWFEGEILGQNITHVWWCLSRHFLDLQNMLLYFGRPMIIQRRFQTWNKNMCFRSSSSLPRFKTRCNCHAAIYIYWMSHTTRGYYLLDIVYRGYKDPATASGYHVCKTLWFLPNHVVHCADGAHIMHCTAS